MIKELHKVLFRKHLMVEWTGVSTPQLGQLNINKFTIMEECKKKKFQTQTQRLKKKQLLSPKTTHTEKREPAEIAIFTLHHSPTPRPSQIYTLQLVFACAILKQKSMC